MREDMAKLRVSILVDRSVRAHAEVAPAGHGALELDPLDLAAGGLESIVRVLGSDARRDHMARRVDVLVLQEVNGARGVLRILAVEPADLRNLLQGDAHGDLQLRCRQVHLADLLGDWVLHLQTRVELQEIEILGCRVVQVLNCAGADVTNVLRQALRSTLHLEEDVLRHDGWGPLLEDLLEATLRRAIAPVKSHCVPVLVTHNLHLDVAGALAELHDEDRRARRGLVLHLREAGLNLLAVRAHADALAAATLRGLQHHGVADALSAGDGLVDGAEARLVEDLVRDGALRGQVGLQAVPAPGDRRHASGLCQDAGRDLVTKHGHDGRARAHERNAELRQLRGESRVLGGVAPAGPHGVHALLPSDLADQIHVGVVVHVLAGRHLHVGAGHAHELGVRVQVIARGHGDELEDVVHTRLREGPRPQRHHGLCSRHAVASDQDPA
mmetsp:Transcript_92558/g.238967  ORF Transcript_92558/g.238967 Transcript_92558/m.238967 type:complete len:442 (-) Transcript_92558:210-1535(-)